MVTSKSALEHARGQAPEEGRRRSTRKDGSLGVVDRKNLLERARRRQARVLVTLSGCIIAGSLAVAAGGQALLAASQVRADALQTQVASALATQQNEQATRAQLETPTRILYYAEHRFKMVAPSGVTYLPPVNPGESVAAAHAPATVASPHAHSASPAHARSAHTTHSSIR